MEDSTVPTTHNPFFKPLQKRIRALRKKLVRIESTDKSVSIRGDSAHLNEDQLCLLRTKPSVEFLLEALEQHMTAYFTESNSTSKDIQDTGGDRYLCVSDGFVILCLDLHLNKDPGVFKDYTTDLDTLPNICTLKLVHEGFPVSAGFLKLGSNAYLVGGHEFPLLKNSGVTDTSEFLYQRDTYKGSPSLKTYRLYLANGIPSLSESTDAIKPLNKPMLWPIVEKIGSEVHLIESFHPYWCFPAPSTTLSHEVLNTDDLCRGWHQVSSTVLPRVSTYYDPDLPRPYPWFSLAVADRIYSRGPTDQFEVFDSTTNQCQLHEYMPYYVPRLYCIKHVAELLLFGFRRCVGKFLDRELTRDSTLYVVIAAGIDYTGRYGAAAYLVTPTGQVLCYQRLPLFYGGFMRRFYGSPGTVISVDEDEGKTLCAIVPGRSGIPEEHFLFISTFTVEEIPNSGSLLPSLWGQKSDEVWLGGLPDAVERSFVNVAVKDWNAYKLADDGIRKYPQRVNACFLRED